MNDTPVTIDDVRAVLVNAVATEVSIPSADVATDQPFTSYGLDSMAALVFAVEIEESFGLSDLPVNLLWDYPTVEALTGALWQLMNAELAPSAAENK
jgi:acyl carrier protein